MKTVKVYVEDVGDCEPFWIVCPDPACRIEIETMLVPPILPEQKMECDWCGKSFLLKVLP
jgi:hypothetical protein